MCQMAIFKKIQGTALAEPQVSTNDSAPKIRVREPQDKEKEESSGQEALSFCSGRERGTGVG